jgi:hypothetical protein
MDASVAAVNAIRVLDSRDFFQPDLLPRGLHQLDTAQQQTPWFLRA